MARDGGKRLERGYRRVRPRSLGLRALDIERRGKADALPRGDQAQRFVVRQCDRAHGLELARRADQDEVVRGDVGQHQKTHAPLAVFRRQSFSRRRGGGRAQAARKVDLPGNVYAAA